MTRAAFAAHADGARAGVKAEGPIAQRATQLSLQEARQILGVEKDAPLEEVLKVHFCRASYGTCIVSCFQEHLLCSRCTGLQLLSCQPVSLSFTCGHLIGA